MALFIFASINEFILFSLQLCGDMKKLINRVKILNFNDNNVLINNKIITIDFIRSISISRGDLFLSIRPFNLPMFEQKLIFTRFRSGCLPVQG